MAYDTLVRRREGPRRAKISMTIAPQLDRQSGTLLPSVAWR